MDNCVTDCLQDKLCWFQSLIKRAGDFLDNLAELDDVDLSTADE